MAPSSGYYSGRGASSAASRGRPARMGKAKCQWDAPAVPPLPELVAAAANSSALAAEALMDIDDDMKERQASGLDVGV